MNASDRNASAIQRAPHYASMALCLLVPTLLQAANEGPKRMFNLTATAAEKSLKAFSEQSGCGVIFVTDLVKGARTNPVKGELVAREALDAMLAGTGLVWVQDEKTAAFSVKRGSVPNGPGTAQAPPGDRSHDSLKKNEIETPPIQPPMKRNRLLAKLAVAVALLFAPAAPAAEGAGTITGRVQNVATGQYLNNVRITVKETGRTVFTDDFGSYVITDVSSGQVAIEAFYTGLDPQVVRVDVPPGQRVEQDISLTSQARYGKTDAVIKLDEFVVSASKETEGEALATNEQRFAPNVKTVLATNAFEDVTEGNAAEFLKFLPGLVVNYENATPITVSVRGFDDNLSTVSFDGDQVANVTGSSTRAFQFKQTSINNTSRIEVTKVPTPANPADSLGGSVNMVSKSAFERSGAQFNYRAYLSMNGEELTLKKTQFPYEKNTYKAQPSFDFDYTLPINKNFGIVLTGLVSKQFNLQSIPQHTWNGGGTGTGTGATPDRPYLQTMAMVDAPKYIHRKSISLRADWRVHPHGVLSFNGQWNDFRDDNASYSVSVGAGNNGTPSIATGVPMSYSENHTSGATGRGSIGMGSVWHHIVGRGGAASVRYRFDNGDWRIHTGVSHSWSGSWRDTGGGHFQQLNTALNFPVRVAFEGFDSTRAPASIRVFDNNNQEIDPYDIGNRRVTTAGWNPITNNRGEITVLSADVRRQLKRLPIAVQVGARQKHEMRDNKRRSELMTFSAPANGDTNASQFASIGYRGGSYDFGPAGIPKDMIWASPTVAWEAWDENSGLFVPTAAQLVAAERLRIQNSQRLEEVVSALYAQAEARLFKNRLTLLTGIRYEKTEDDGLGQVVEPAAVFARDATGEFLRDAAGNRIRRPEAGAVGSMEELLLTTKERAARADRSYDGYYPSFHVTFNVRENLLVRAAYAKTYGRPNFGSVIPNTTITEFDVDSDADLDVLRGRINVVNTGLKPWTADNYDISLEYYTKEGGVFSAGAFQKEIKDFFGDKVTLATLADLQELGLDPQYEGWDLRTRLNVGDARVSGVELSARHSLDVLGSWGRHFTVFANGTRLHLEGSSIASFGKFVPRTANWGFRFSRKPISIMAKWNYRGLQRMGAVAALGPDARNYWAPRTTLDVNTSYQWSKRISFFANARNIFNKPLVRLTYGSQTPAYARTAFSGDFGVQLAVGVKGTF